MDKCSSSVVSIQKGDKFSFMQCPRNELERNQMEIIPYASIVGSLLYALTSTRPDINFAVGMLDRYQSNPGIDHWKAAKKVLRFRFCRMCGYKKVHFWLFVLHALRLQFMVYGCGTLSQDLELLTALPSR
ncbi:Endonuclease/exonuclease/phosphatase [Cucumis melo var. makuwa]|uniref:Endonuclease/exonuclease/phosphatase n=1 Tax=Cucumis melo var. makuwa TaxID=1194695 RepID=A0A5A7UE05_CUCMM|nr:Endonuclease/exonuclease/phosphatase [Cucumis melo var. makuwa]TYK20708.1 Endonuclease/exonuclease/phosphatase [Cucumis melo var. makuwa]